MIVLRVFTTILVALIMVAILFLQQVNKEDKTGRGILRFMLIVYILCLICIWT
jgi:glycopeptide antibiotics resistance protein